MSGATIARALAETARALAAAGVPEPRREAQVLLGHALRAGREAILGHPERPLDAAAAARLAAAAERRRRREPTAYILGVREFWSLEFVVSPATLIPRPDSETVVALALDLAGDGVARVLDLGTGSGCLLLAVLAERPRAVGVGVDASPAALAVAAENARRLGLAARARLVAGDWGAALSGAFDLILCNPPYVPRAEWPALAPEVAAHEPEPALVCGDDPLAAYRRLGPDLARLLTPSGVAVVEVAMGRADAVARLLAGHGLAAVARRRDLAGIERALAVGHR